MQKIVGLYAIHDSGKTETLNWLIALLDQAVNGVPVPPLPVPPNKWKINGQLSVIRGR